MAGSSRAEGRPGAAGWVATGLGILVLMIGGFALGLIVGVISEEPELVVGHVAGRSTEVDWSAGSTATPADGSRTETAPAARAGAPEQVAVAPGPRSPGSPGQAGAGRTTTSPSGSSRESAPSLPSVAARGPAPSPAPRPADAGAGFAIQVGAFASAEAAQGLAGRLRSAGYPVRVVAPERDDRWRVRVGPVASREEADRTARRLKTEQKLPTWVLREERS